jgi:hypothetical protein
VTARGYFLVQSVTPLVPTAKAMLIPRTIHLISLFDKMAIQNFIITYQSTDNPHPFFCYLADGL